MNNQKSKNQQSENKNTVILKNPFNIIFRHSVYFQGASNNQYFFQNYDEISQLFGYQQFVLGGQPKMLKKYFFENQRIVILNKSNEFFIIYPKMKIELWKFDRFHNCKKQNIIYQDFDNKPQYRGNIQEIGINQSENLFVFQKYCDIVFYSRRENDEWIHEQTVDSFNYFDMNQIRFNESNNIIVAYQMEIVKKQGRQDFLIILQRNQYGIWSITHRIQQNNSFFRDDLFYFIDDQQFVQFEQNQNIKYIQEISKTNYEAKIKSQETIEFATRKCLQFGLIEITSKHLILLYHRYFFYLKQSKLLNSLTQLPQFIGKIGCHENSHCSSLFLSTYCNFGNRSQIKVYRIYVE